MKQHFVMLADKFNPAKHKYRGMWMSEKLDGMRMLWDGGITRGLAAEYVPWANTAKHSRFKDQIMATGLWTRYGQPINAPDWFLDSLPPIPLDGEAYIGPGEFQRTVSIVNSKVNLADWRDIKYAIFDVPSPFSLFTARTIDVPTATFQVPETALMWAQQMAERRGLDLKKWQTSSPISVAALSQMRGILDGKHHYLLDMQQLPVLDEKEAERTALTKMDEVLAKGGEGLMLRNTSQRWESERVKGLLKLKPAFDAEGIVVGYKFAEPGKIAGLIGAVIVQMPNGKTFELSGFTDAERRFTSDAAHAYAVSHPGELAPNWVEGKALPRGSKITYVYRELTDDGLPREARYWRKNHG